MSHACRLHAAHVKGWHQPAAVAKLMAVQTAIVRQLAHQCGSSWLIGRGKDVEITPKGFAVAVTAIALALALAVNTHVSSLPGP